MVLTEKVSEQVMMTSLDVMVEVPGISWRSIIHGDYADVMLWS
jgi:hypothetical protein